MVRLLILGLLSRRPMYGYEVQQYLQMTRSDQWAGILVGSIYHALKKMEGEGLLEIQALEQTGHRTRAVYAITAAGRAEFRHLLRETWRTPSRTLPSALYTALTFLPDLPRAEVLQAIDEQIAALERELADWDAGEAAKAQYAPDPTGLMTALFANGRAHYNADLTLLRQVRETLPRLPEMNWEIPPLEEEPR